MRKIVCVALLLSVALSACVSRPNRATPKLSQHATNLYKMEEGFVDANGVMIYYTVLGRGEPLMIVHGGPGASHDYLLPYLLPLARTNRLVFIDERGSGRSTTLEDPSGYTVENMVEDVEAVRTALNLGKMSLLGHSYGGVLAEAYALKYQQNLTHLILCSTFHSTKMLNDVFKQMLANMSPELRGRIEKMEKAGLFGHGKDYEKNRYTDEYMKAAWGEGYFPYLYQKHPDPNYDPGFAGTSWALYREMWGSHGEFVVDGNLSSVEYGDRLGTITVPTLITVGDHDEVDPSIAKDMQAKIPGSRLVILPDSGHMTFVDQPGMFISAVDDFIHGK
ncbi:MAG TPA: proline iminopeptidase-family hydrolase [Candidatus Krumholzibacteria bacterium]|nr:proline iminopeptidase-family hydrolase [Candidatus Krumholzibacteria bacterium]